MSGCVGRRAARAAAASSLFALLVAPGCFTYSSYQSARIVERGEPHATLSLSRSRIVQEGPDKELWWAIEGGMRFGLAKRFDGALCLSVFQNVPEDWGAAVVTADVRAGLVENVIAFAMPVSVTLGDFYLASLRMQPGIIATVPLGERAEVNGSVRAHIFVRLTDIFAVGYNIGLGLTSETGEWTLRPELGWLQFTGQNAGLTYAQYGVGLEYNGRRTGAGK